MVLRQQTTDWPRASDYDTDLVALRPGGGTRALLQQPAHHVGDLDVAQDLLRDGRFGGPAPKPAAFPAATWLYPTALGVLAAIVLPPWVGWLLVRRARRRIPATMAATKIPHHAR